MPIEAMKAAAERGDPRAQNALGWAYDVGEGVAQELAKEGTDFLPSTADAWMRG
jgi:TPR repeat protein